MTGRAPAAMAAFLIAGGVAFAQPTIEVSVERGLMKDRPYTVIFPRTMESIPAAAYQAIALQDGPLQCDLRITQAPAGAVTPTLATFRKDAAVAEQRIAWADFDLTGQAATGAFQSGPVLIYSGQMTGFDSGQNTEFDKTPLSLVHAEAIDQGRRYVFECIIERKSLDKYRPLIRFLIANVSTRSDGKCCVQPDAAPR